MQKYNFFFKPPFFARIIYNFLAEVCKEDSATRIRFLDLCQVIVVFTLFLFKTFGGLVKSHYLCNVFFIVLDLRLTKVGVQRYSFFCFL